MSIPLVITAKSPRDQANYLAWQHCWLQWRVGLLLLVPGTSAYFILAPLVNFGRPSSLLEAASILLVSCIYLGIPAGAFGMVRVPLMQGLFKRALTWPPADSRRLLLGTALIYVLPIIPLYLWMLFGLQNDFDELAAGFKLLFLLVPSLPWLVGSLWATWKLWAQWQSVVAHAYSMEAG